MIDKISKDLFSVENIRKLVYYIRNEQVMLDYDLAVLYGYEVKRLNEQVKRHINRFPKDFMFQLTNDEVKFIREQKALGKNRKEVYTKFSNKISFGSFENIWYGCNWKSLT